MHVEARLDRLLAIGGLAVPGERDEADLARPLGAIAANLARHVSDEIPSVPATARARTIAGAVAAAADLEAALVMRKPVGGTGENSVTL